MKKQATYFKNTASVETVEMTRGTYNEYRGWATPLDENPEDKGVLIIDKNVSARNHPDHDGYISWSPLEGKFLESHRINGELTFGQAIEELKKGKRIARKGWNGKGMFIFQQVPATIGEEIVPKMQSLPDSVKAVFEKRAEEGIPGISYKNQIAMVYPDSVIYGWVASPSDVLEEDWQVLED